MMLAHNADTARVIGQADIPYMLHLMNLPGVAKVPKGRIQEATVAMCRGRIS